MCTKKCSALSNIGKKRSEASINCGIVVSFILKAVTGELKSAQKEIIPHRKKYESTHMLSNRFKPEQQVGGTNKYLHIQIEQAIESF